MELMCHGLTQAAAMYCTSDFSHLPPSPPLEGWGGQSEKKTKQVKPVV